MTDQRTKEAVELHRWAWPSLHCNDEGTPGRDFYPHSDLNACAELYPVLRERGLWSDYKDWLEFVVCQPAPKGCDDRFETEDGCVDRVLQATPAQITEALLKVARENPREEG